MTPDLFLDEPWSDSDSSFLDPDTITTDPCGLAWLPLLALYVVVGSAAAGVVLLADRLLQRRKS